LANYTYNHVSDIQKLVYLAAEPRRNRAFRELSYKDRNATRVQNVDNAQIDDEHIYRREHLREKNKQEGSCVQAEAEDHFNVENGDCGRVCVLLFD
jgi:hypothetical protein